MIKELRYQLEAVQELTNRANRWLERTGNKTLVFEAPTGSGKTIMMAEFLKSLIENRTDDKLFSFLWCAPRKLHKQSKKKLEKHYEDSKALRCSHFEDLSDKKIDENEILFLNWESINEEDNIIIRENEENFNLSNVLQNTRDEGRIIVLLIDESHFAAKTETSLGLINMFDPKLTIEVSATPKLQGDDKYTVDREDVIIEEMIKKDILINPDLDNIVSGVMADGYKIKSSGEEESVDRLINMALAKKDKLLQAYQDEGSFVNPLMLIQLPPRNVDEDMKEEVIAILKDRFVISEDNGKLAIYLSEGSVNRENIEKKDSPVEVMIFKVAIALGWDCPRAHILVQLRDWRSITFSMQTVGRITRMPELKHYENDELNVGYIYTNSGDLSIHKSIAGSYASIHNSTRKDIYEEITLLSVHSKRIREKDRLNRKFINHFLIASEKLNLKDNIKIDVDETTRKMLSDGIITNPDQDTDHIDTGSVIAFPQNEKDIQHYLDTFVRENLEPFFPQKRSIGKVKTSFYDFFKKEFPDDFDYNGTKAQMVVLDTRNQQAFIDVLNEAKKTYKEEVERIAKEIETDENWEIKKSINYSESFLEKEVEKCIVVPFFENERATEPEKKFVDYLENNSNVEWWFKNGDRDKTYFAVPYTDGDDTKPFYVDFIVKYKNGTIGFFDTKGDLTAQAAKSKAEGLYEYIQKENEKGKHLFGGILYEKDGSFWLNNSEKFSFSTSDPPGDDWEILPSEPS